MTENDFRIVVAVAVTLAVLAFVIQAGVVIAVYRGSKKTQHLIAKFTRDMKAVLSKVEPVLNRINPERIGTTIGRMGPVIDKLAPAADKISQMVDKMETVCITANRILDDTRPQIKELTGDVVALTKSGREQMECLGGFLQDASERARTRLQQIDHTIESAVSQVEYAGNTVKRAAMKQVKEANGLAAGISTAVSILLHGSRKSSVDSATQEHPSL
jgi:ABC-type transporter Mla subunit MlaD